MYSMRARVNGCITVLFNTEEFVMENNTNKNGLSPAAADMMEVLEVLQITEDPSLMLIAVKYLAFDLEATRRENEYLRRMLIEKNPSN